MSNLALFPTVAGTLRGVPIRTVNRPGEDEPLFVLTDVVRAVAPAVAPQTVRRQCLNMRSPHLQRRGRLPDGRHVLACQYSVLSVLEQLAAIGAVDVAIVGEMEKVIAGTPGLVPIFPGAQTMIPGPRRSG